MLIQGSPALAIRTHIYIIQALGATGRIEKIDEDGDVYVKIKNNTWILSPVCIKPSENEDVAAKIPAIPTEKPPTRRSPDFFAVVNGIKIYHV